MKPAFTHWLRTGYALRINLRTGFLLVAHYSKDPICKNNASKHLSTVPSEHVLNEVEFLPRIESAASDIQHGIHLHQAVPTQMRTGYAPVSHYAPFRTGCALVSIHHDFVSSPKNNVSASWHCALVTHCCGNMRTGLAPKSPSSFCGATKSFTHWSYALVPVRRIKP